MVALLITMAMLTPLLLSSALAEEEFTYCDGIQFGMTIDQVKALEPNEPSDYDDDALFYAKEKVAGENASIFYMMNRVIVGSVIVIG